jgi:hypothetical protein
VADSSKRADDAAWDDLDQAFFASAPPDVPEAPAEPERFDDLFPAAAATPTRRARAAASDGFVAPGRAAAAVAASRAFLRRASGAVGGRARPALASVGRLTSASWRVSARALGGAGRATARAARAAIPAAARIAGALRVGRLSGQTIAIVVAVVVLVTGLSAVVVASRGSGHANLPATTLESRGSAGRATVAAVTPAPATSPLAPAPEPMQSVLPDPAPAAPEPEAEAPARVHAAPTPAASEGSQETSESRHRHADAAAKHPAAAAPKHRRPSYSAEKDLILPSFMQEQPQAPKAAHPQAAPASAGPTRQQPPTAYRPAQPAAPAPPARPLFSR